MFTKRFEEETNLRCHLIIDCSSSMFFPFEKESTLDKLTFSAEKNEKGNATAHLA